MRLRSESRLEIQLRVLFALIVREMITRYGRSAGGYIWAIAEPLATIALLSFIFSQMLRHPELGTNFPVYFASAYLPFHIYMDISRAVSVAVQVNRPLLSFPRITMLDVVLARFILQLLTSVTVLAVVMSSLVFYFDVPVQLDFHAILAAITYAALLGLGVGTLNCVLFAFSPTWQRVFNIVNRPLFLISGIFFTYESLPVDLQRIIWWNPLLHITATMRRGFYAEYHAAFTSPVFVLICALTTLMLGVLLLRVLRVRVLEIIDQ